MEYLKWLSAAANIDMRFAEWYPGLTAAPHAFEGVLDMVYYGVNQTQTSVVSFLVNKQRERVLDFAGKREFDKWPIFLYAVVPDSEAVGNLRRNEVGVWSSLGILGGYVWMALVGVGVLIWGVLVAVRVRESGGVVTEEALVVADRLIRMLFKLDCEPLVTGIRSVEFLVLLWSLICVIFVACYTGGIMSVTQIVLPFKIDDSMDRWGCGCSGIRKNRCTFSAFTTTGIKSSPAPTSPRWTNS